MTASPKDRARTHLEHHAKAVSLLEARCMPDLLTAAGIVCDAFRAGGKLLLCGNGGSAGECQHLAAEFVSRLHRENDRKALPAIALTTDTSFLTAYMNDVGVDGIFARQIEALGKSGDVLLAMSTSGTSPNILAAAKQAKAIGVKVIAFTGETGALADMSDVAVRVPSSDTQIIQELHLTLGHVLCETIEYALFRQ